MLSLKRHRRGFSLIELMVTIAVLAVLLAAGTPTLGDWLVNGQIRAAASAIQDGLQAARAQAVARNTAVRFQLVSSLDEGCEVVPEGEWSAGVNWVISLDSPDGDCAGRLVDDAYPVEDRSRNPAPRMLDRRAGGEGSASAAVLASDASVVMFNGMGRATTPATTFRVIHAKTGEAGCATPANPGNAVRCLNVEVSSGGQVRMCDPARQGNPDQPGYDPQGCLRSSVP